VDIESLRPSCKDVQNRDLWRLRIKGKPAANPSVPGKMAVIMVSVCILFN